MSRRRIEATEIFSIPESTSLDTIIGYYPESVKASIEDQDGDIYLRVASKKSDDPEMTEEDIQDKILEWKKHAREHATNAGFRKANSGRNSVMDPRRFALQLAEVARLNASRYGSSSLLRLARKLRWVASQERGVAEKALDGMATPLEGEARRRDDVGMSFIQKPPEQTVSPSLKLNEEPQIIPGESVEYGQDQSWRARESGRIAREKEKDSELLTMARDFLQDYKSRNSLYDEDLMEQLQDPDIFESWLLDLDGKGVNPDADQLDEAWNGAMNEIAEGSGESLSEGMEELPPVSATRDKETIQEYTAPGGDWSNTVINLFENPVMDRYLKDMRDKREGRSRVSRQIEVEAEIAEAVDQCLDYFAGEMLPGEISADHVKGFMEDRFPDVDWEKVYEAIQKISDPKRRHEEDPKERTNQEASRRVRVRPGGTEGVSRGGRRVSRGGRGVEVSSNSRSGLRHYREICACCKGTGERGDRCCGRCHGSGQTGMNLMDEDRDKKEKIAAKLGSLLVVSVDAGNRRISAADRQELARVTRTRVASKGKPLVFKHSTELMKVLAENGIPYRTASYRHPEYKK